LLHGDPDYPALLGHVEAPPPALIVRGDTRLFERPTVAMVGARNASSAGVRFARALAHDLSERGWLVVSGLARGIDTSAHVGSIAGGTAAVIAGGIDIVFPPENAKLQAEIAERGVLIAVQQMARAELRHPLDLGLDRGERGNGGRGTAAAKGQPRQRVQRGNGAAEAAEQHGIADRADPGRADQSQPG
jgi:hypothetical protein